MSLTLEDLPAELLLHIHLLSLSSALPYVSRHIRALFANTSSFHRARYLLLRHDRKTLSHAVKYQICTLDVIHTLERIASSEGKKLKCPQLPRRVVRGLGSSKGGDEERPVDLPLITYLLEKYGASPNSSNGYPLARAVFARHVPLIRLLLKYGADPSLQDGWAVTTAIANGDSGLVKLLMEREPEREEGEEGGGGGGGDEVVLKEEGVNGAKKRRKRRDSGGGGKRRKMEDRCKATKEMLETAVKAKQWGIVDYLTAKGAMPSIDVLGML
ncbi:hypothetical protein JCM6882_004063 [Rhodosporidiobolus microsporus]